MSREVEKHWSVISDRKNNLSFVARCNDTLNMNLYLALIILTFTGLFQNARLLLDSVSNNTENKFE